MYSISIVVPIYNAADRIATLVQQVELQSYPDWELILVNDGSTDASLQVCEELAQRDSRIVVIDQKNQGPSVARNVGIDKAKGEWITFVDADDALLDNYLNSMSSEAVKFPSVDIVYAGYVIIERLSNEVYTYNTAHYIGQLEVAHALAQTNILHRCCPWGKLFRRSIMIDNNLRFDAQLRHSEDRLFIYNYLLHTRGIATTSCIGYIYDSTTTTSLKNKLLGPEMLYLRQQKLQEAAHAVIVHYGLRGEELFMFVKHLLGLFANSIQSIYENTGNVKLSLVSQEEFYSKFFDHFLYEEIKDTEKWTHFLKDNQMMQWAINKEFKKINSHLAYINKKIAIRQFLSKALHQKTKQKDFQNSITLMNR